MTVMDHLKAQGYDTRAALNAATLNDRGTMECDSIKIRKFRCCPDCVNDALGVTATAIVPMTDGTMQPYPSGWTKSLQASVTLYFPLVENDSSRY